MLLISGDERILYMGHLISMNNNQIKCIKKRRYRPMDLLEYAVLLTASLLMEREVQECCCKLAVKKKRNLIVSSYEPGSHLNLVFIRL